MQTRFDSTTAINEHQTLNKITRPARARARFVIQGVPRES